MKKRVFALLLCLAMVLPLVACANNPQENTTPSIRLPEELDWLNISTESFDLPIVKEGTEKSLTIWYRTAGGTVDPEQTWSYKFAVEHMNINLEVRPLYSSNQAEVLSTAFATGDLPDIIIGSKFTTADLVKYGVLEEQLLDLAPYMEAGYMPNLAGLIEMTPAYGEAITDSEGHIWSAPYIGIATTANGLSRMYLNYDWLEDAGLSVPKTTDEFLAAMRAMKAQDNSRYPVGGSWNTYSPIEYLLNGFGFIGQGNITDICLYNGQVTMPAANREAYGAFVEYMHTLYQEGLLHPDFFTMDKDTTNAQMTQGKNGFWMEAPHLTNAEDSTREFWGAYPLTSSTHATSEWPMGSKAILAGGAIVTTACKEPELACVFLDWFFDTVNYANWSYMPMGEGPFAHYSQYLCGFKGGYIKDSNIRRLDFDTDPKAQKKYGSGWTWATNYIHMWYDRFGLKIDLETGKEAYIVSQKEIDTNPDIFPVQPIMESAADRKNAELDYKTLYLWAMEDTLEPCVTTDVLSMNVYFDVDTTERVADLMQVINEYANTEFAKFVTGKRPLSELDAYFNEIERIGALELIQIYKDYYGR